MYEGELGQRIPDPEVLLKLEPEELAGILLPILRKSAATYQGKVSGYNFCNAFHQMQEIYPRQVVPEVTRAIMEALELDAEQRPPSPGSREPHRRLGLSNSCLRKAAKCDGL